MQKNFLSEVLTNHRSWKRGLPYIVSIQNAQIDEFWNAAWTKIEYLQLDMITLCGPIGFISTAGTSGFWIPYVIRNIIFSINVAFWRNFEFSWQLFCILHHFHSFLGNICQFLSLILTNILSFSCIWQDFKIPYFLRYGK